MKRPKPSVRTVADKKEQDSEVVRKDKRDCKEVPSLCDVKAEDIVVEELEERVTLRFITETGHKCC